jgi:hypothetical protein
MITGPEMFSDEAGFRLMQVPFYIGFIVFPAGVAILSPLHRVQTGSGTHPAFLSNGHRGQSGRSVKPTIHLRLVPRWWMFEALPVLPRYIYMAWCIVQHRDNFACTFVVLIPFAICDSVFSVTC